MNITNKIYASDSNSSVINHVPTSAKRILDIGCGAGGNAKALNHLGKNVDGITISEAEAEEAKKYCANVYLHNLETGLPNQVNGEYDAVICSHVLEHLCYPQALLKDIRNILAPGGTLIVALPNILYLKNRLDLFFGNFEYTDGGTMDSTHFRWYTFKSGNQLLTKNDFDVYKSTVSGHLPMPFLRRFIPKYIREKLDLIVCKLWPGLFGHELIYLAHAEVSKK
jgi:SAM-dependent methyltransferase